MKRIASSSGVVSPPAKRRIGSTTTKNVVKNFFKPASQKEPEQITWRVIEDSVLVGHYHPLNSPPKADSFKEKRSKIAAFDFDSTLIRTSSGNVFGKGPSDWTWWHTSVPAILKGLHGEGFIVAIISNQGGITLNDPKTLKTSGKRLSEFKTKVAAVLSNFDFAISIYAATTRDHYRKPRTGMWMELLEDCDLDVVRKGPDLQTSFFVGDAAGRLADSDTGADHSSSDRDFAANVGIAFKSPEEFFLDEKARPFIRTFEPNAYTNNAVTLKADASKSFNSKSPNLIIFCGSPGSGKSSYYWNVLQPLGYERVNQDILKTRERCVKVALGFISSGKSVAVDNTNADLDTRKVWIELAQKANIPVRCVHFTALAKLCEHNDTFRALNSGAMNPEKRTILPHSAFTTFASRFREPHIKEGFAEIIPIDFELRGESEVVRLWGKYWI